MIEALQYEFMRNALIAGLLASVACGVVGSYIVIKRIVFISGGISHASFGGIGLGYYLGINPILGAVLFSITSAMGIGIISKKAAKREDTAIAILWSLGMALGILFISLTPGYAPDLFSYLFGNILTVPRSDLMLMAILDIVIIGLVFALYKELLAISFDEEFASIVGVPVNQLYLLILCLTALTVVVLIRIVGVILVIALLTIPAAISEQYTHNMKKIIFYAVILGAFFTFTGLWFSYIFDLPSGATIILISGIAFFIASLLRTIRNRNFVISNQS
ncbi:MAG: metal ABC transporter permease [Candidatus Bathyarchaeota archaeon]|nr:metal ABC transporter permease [Candidatus Bathyarchaeota archaeon]